MSEALFWLLLPLLISAPALLVYTVSLIGWIFSPKESKRREAFNKICKVSSRIIIGWFAFLAVSTACITVFFSIFGVPAQM